MPVMVGQGRVKRCKAVPRVHALKPSGDLRMQLPALSKQESLVGRIPGQDMVEQIGGVSISLDQAGLMKCAQVLVEAVVGGFRKRPDGMRQRRSLERAPDYGSHFQNRLLVERKPG